MSRKSTHMFRQQQQQQRHKESCLIAIAVTFKQILQFTNHKLKTEQFEKSFYFLQKAVKNFDHL